LSVKNSLESINKSKKPIIKLHKICREFDTGQKVMAVNSVNLEVFSGDYISVTGVSGSGKSTLLNILGMLDVATSGKYLIDGVNVTELSDDERSFYRAEKIGFVFQDFHLISTRSALENVALGLLYKGLGLSQRLELASEMIGRVNLSGRAEALPSTMSGGERQRVAIARALVNQPSIMLCDEPTGSLDSKNTLDILRVLDELNASGVTIINVTHDIVASKRATRQIHIKDGVLI
jgi:macrolide transport system ATP-binding/permease protein